MQEVIEIRTPEAIKAFNNLAAVIRANYPEKVQNLLFTRIIVGVSRATFSDPLSTPMTIWKVDIKAIRFILAAKRTDLSKANPLTIEELEKAFYGAPRPLFDEVLKLYLETPENFERLLGACSKILSTVQTVSGIADLIPVN